MERPQKNALNSKLALLRQRLAEKGIKSPSISPIPKREPGGARVLSFAQQRMWFLNQLQPSSSLYNVSHAYRLQGQLDITAVKSALEAITRRHEILRTRFELADNDPAQVIGDAVKTDFVVQELSGLAPEEREAALRRRIAQEADTPFDLTRAPLLRVRLWRLGETEQVMQCTFHHIVTDGWSRGVLLRELGGLYAAVIAGQASPLPALPIQYVDYALWQRQRLDGGQLARQLEYWREQLGGDRGELELPADRPRPPVVSFRGAVHRFSVPAAWTAPLKALSQEAGATLFMVLLAAFKVLLYRYTGQTDLLVGSPIAGRTRRELESLIGFFVNTLVLRTDLGGAPSFRELVGRVRETALAAYEHQELPFEKLVEELQPERNMSRNPLFQVMFVLQNIPDERLRLGEVGGTQIPVGIETAKFDLTLSLSEKKGQLQGILEYATDLFDADRIKRMAGHFLCLLEGILANPDTAITELPLLTAAERQQLLVDWNATKTDFPRNVCIHKLFRLQAERTPKAVALVFEGRQLSYAELDARANQLAHYLIALGVRADTLVGLCVERSIEMLVGMLGILKAGGAYVPLDPAYPKERLAFMLEDTAALVLLTQERLIEALPVTIAKMVCLDRDWDEITTQPDTDPPPCSGPDNLAYVIYTSGSTGQPKGVEVQHRNLVNHTLALSEVLGVVSDDQVLQIGSPSFDIVVDEIYPTLLTGAVLILYPDPSPGAAEQFESFVIDQQITIVHLPTAYWQEWVNALEDAGRQLPTCLRLCGVGGEEVPARTFKRWRKIAGNSIHWINLYGPTEATVAATAWVADFTAEDAAELFRVPIGRPEANVCCYLLDPQRQPVPVGVPGELYIGGAGVARGYLNRPELTAERFIPDPFSSDSDDRLYRTGDRVRYLPDGNLEFLGRLDHQIKLRGYRIELGEIEAALCAHSAIASALVMVRETAPGDQRLVAYVVPGQNQTLAVSGLRDFLKAKLPEYMLPAAFVELERLPLAPNGKLDRKALPLPEAVRPELKEAYLAPRTPVEKALAGIWAEVLGIEQVGVHDNFFELGGHSLLATQVVSRVNKTFGINLPLHRLFESPQVGELSRVIEETQRTDDEVSRSPIKPVSRTSRRFITSSTEAARADADEEMDGNKGSR